MNRNKVSGDKVSSLLVSGKCAAFEGLWDIQVEIYGTLNWSPGEKLETGGRHTALESYAYRPWPKGTNKIHDGQQSEKQCIKAPEFYTDTDK